MLKKKNLTKIAGILNIESGVKFPFLLRVCVCVFILILYLWAYIVLLLYEAYTCLD